MQVQISIEMRAGMNEASKRLGMSQLSLIRSAISAFLQAHGTEVGGEILADSRNLRGSQPMAAGGVMEPVPEPTPEPVTEPDRTRDGAGARACGRARIVPEPAPEPDQSIVPMSRPGPADTDPNPEIPKQAPATKKPRGKKGGQS